jgi:hypothetical protein
MLNLTKASPQTSSGWSLVLARRKFVSKSWLCFGSSSVDFLLLRVKWFAAWRVVGGFIIGFLVTQTLLGMSIAVHSIPRLINSYTVVSSCEWTGVAFHSAIVGVGGRKGNGGNGSGTHAHTANQSEKTASTIE